MGVHAFFSYCGYPCGREYKQVSTKGRLVDVTHYTNRNPEDQTKCPVRNHIDYNIVNVNLNVYYKFTWKSFIVITNC